MREVSTGLAHCSRQGEMPRFWRARAFCRDLLRSTTRSLRDHFWIFGYDIRRTRFFYFEAESGVTPIGAVYESGSHFVTVDVPITKCVDVYGFDFDPAGWHPFVATLRQYLDCGHREYAASVLERYYAAWQPRNAAEALGIADLTSSASLKQLPALASLPPWQAAGPENVARKRSVFRRPGRLSVRNRYLDASHGVQFFGPVSSTRGTIEFERLARVVESLRRRGYHRRIGWDGDIQASVLSWGQDQRFVVRNGLHRAAALAALGHATIPVRIKEVPVRIIHLSDARHWPQVRKGVFSLEAAEAYARRLFTDSGHDSARRRGLDPALIGSGLARPVAAVAS